MNKLISQGGSLLSVQGVSQLARCSVQTFAKWAPHQQLVAVNTLAFGWWLLGSGINAQWMQRHFSMTPGSSPLTMATTHFFHYDPFLFAFNTAVIYRVGNALGSRFNLVGVLGLGLGSALFAAAQMRNDHSKSNLGGLGLSAGLLTVGALSGSMPYARIAIPLSLLGGFYYNDNSLVGGVLSGYALFLIGLL